MEALKKEYKIRLYTKRGPKCKQYRDRMDYLTEIYQNYLKGQGNYGGDWLKKYNEYEMNLYDKYHKLNCPDILAVRDRGEAILNARKKQYDEGTQKGIIRSSTLDEYDGGGKKAYKSRSVSRRGVKKRKTKRKTSKSKRRIRLKSRKSRKRTRKH